MSTEIGPRRVGLPVPRARDGKILPGATPNPSGRRKGVGAMARAILDATRDGAELLEYALRIWRNQVPVLEPDGTERVDEETGDVVLIRGSYSDEQRWQAFTCLLDRGLGRPVATVDLAAVVAQFDGADVGHATAMVDVDELGEDELLALDTVLRRALRPRRRASAASVSEEDAIDVPSEEVEALAPETRVAEEPAITPARSPRVPEVL